MRAPFLAREPDECGISVCLADLRGAEVGHELAGLPLGDGECLEHGPVDDALFVSYEHLQRASAGGVVRCEPSGSVEFVLRGGEDVDDSALCIAAYLPP